MARRPANLEDVGRDAFNLLDQNARRKTKPVPPPPPPPVAPRFLAFAGNIQACRRLDQFIPVEGQVVSVSQKVIAHTNVSRWAAVIYESPTLDIPTFHGYNYI